MDLFEVSAESLINEVLDSPVADIHLPRTLPDSHYWTAVFYVGDRDFTFRAIYAGDGAWEVLFKDDQDSFSTTGKGDQYKVLSTVIYLLKKFVEEKEPEIIVFSAEGQSKISLHNKLVKKFAEEYGYKYTVLNGDGWSTFKIMINER